MIVTAKRLIDYPEATLGALYIDKSMECFTLEDQRQEVKVPGETRIPAGTYTLKLRNHGGLHEKYKNRFAEHRGMIELLDVPGFTDVLIHVGNTDDDSRGCLLLGDGAMATGSVTLSVQAYRRVYRQIASELTKRPVSLVVSDP